MPLSRRGPWLGVLGLGVAVAGTALVTSPAFACAGLVTPGGNVRLVRTATLAAYTSGVEHYITSFKFEGDGANFGAIVPLPAIPSKVERGGDWTLQRLERETAPPLAEGSGGAGGAVAEAASAQVVYQTRIDALDVTVLRGGGQAVGDWARQHGYQLTPDAPEVLDYYAAHSPIFLAARFDDQAAQSRGQVEGDGTPIHLTIPTRHPWVPLRILGLGLGPDDRIGADVYLLTPRLPVLHPLPGLWQAPGLVPERSEPASAQLLADLRSDKGMGWLPDAMWLTYLRVDESAGRLHYDLRIDPRDPRPHPPPATTTTSPPTTTTTISPTTTTTTVPVVHQLAEPLLPRPARRARSWVPTAGAIAAAVALGSLLVPLLLRRRLPHPGR